MTRIISIVGGLQPTAPTIGTATAGDTTASVAFTASSYIGKGTITYTATSSPGGFTGTSATSPITVTGLSNGIAYTFTVVGNTNYGVASAASAASNSITPAPSVIPAFESIASTLLGTTTSVVTFSSIPSTFKHLQIRIVGRSDNGSSDREPVNIKFNNDNSSIYAINSMGSGGNSGASASSLTGLTGTFNLFGGSSTMTGPAQNSNNFGASIIDLVAYQQSSINHTVRSFSGQSYNTTDRMTFIGGIYEDGTAVNRLDIYTTGNWVSKTRISLYGIKG